LSGAVAKLASITFLSLAFSWIQLNLGFLLRENSLLYSSNLPLGVPNWTVIYTITHRHNKERRRRHKEATTKSFVDLQERSVAADEAITKARLLEAETKTKALEAETKARLLEAEARTKLLKTETKTKLHEAQVMLMDEETKIILNALETISDPARREWLENREKTI
jgi:hypothetical protein